MSSIVNRSPRGACALLRLAIEKLCNQLIGDGNKKLDLDKKIENQIAEINRNIDSCCACNTKSISDIDRIRDSLGGHVGPITITLKWETGDDLDLSLVEPNRNEKYYKY